MIDTERKEDLLLDTKLIKSENKLDKLRIIDELHPVLGGQPTHEKDQPNDNNPFLDLACTIKFTIDKADAIDKKADTKLAKAQNLKDVANVAIARDNLGLGTSATLNATSTLSDRTDQVATIKVVNDVNRSAVTAQKTANNAHALAQTKQDKLTFVGSGPEAMKVGAFGLGSVIVKGDVTQEELDKLVVPSFISVIKTNSNNLPSNAVILPLPQFHSESWNTQLAVAATSTGVRMFARNSNNTKVYNQWSEFYTEANTTIDNSGFLRASGSANALTESDRTSSLGTSTTLVASQKLVNDVSQTKQDKLTFVGSGKVMREGAYGLGRGSIEPKVGSVNDLLQASSGFYFAGTSSEIGKHLGNAAVLINLPQNNIYGSLLAVTNSGKVFVNAKREAIFHGWKELLSEDDVAKNTASKNQNGWWKCGDTGLLIQWGRARIERGDAYDSQKVSFPVSFSTPPFSITTSDIDGGKATGSKNATLSNFEVVAGIKPPITIGYIAIGY